MFRWLLALAAIGFASSACAAELEFLRGSAPAYTVAQMPPPLPAFAAPDEDFGIPLGATFAAYSNTISSVSGTIDYGAIDAGVNLLDAPSHKVSAFAGYFFLKTREIAA